MNERIVGPLIALPIMFALLIWLRRSGRAVKWDQQVRALIGVILSAPRWQHALIAIMIGVGAATLAFSFNWIQYYRLTTGGILVQGQVIAKEPTNHRLIRYSYVVHQTTYFGSQSGGYGNVDFNQIRIGDRVPVFYLPHEPKRSCLGNPADLLLNESMVIAFTAIFAPLFIFWTFRRAARRISRSV